MRRLRRPSLLALSLLLPFGAVACGDAGSDSAAVVNGTAISSADLADEIEAILGNISYRMAIESQQAINGQLPDSLDSGFTAAVLTNQISYQLVHDELADRDIEVSDKCRQAAQDDLEMSLGQGEATAGQQVLAAFPGDYAETLIARNADVLALQAELSDVGCLDDKAAQAYLDANAAQFRQACASHILVATDAEANSLLAQIQAGADFATLAREHSTDTQSAVNGGDLGCNAPSLFVTEFANAIEAATPGVVGAPIQTQFGWHLLLVTEFRTPPLEEVRDQIDQVLAQQAVGPFQLWFGEALQAAKITVAERFGDWNPQAGEVVKELPPDTMTSSTSSLPIDPGMGFDPGSGAGG